MILKYNKNSQINDEIFMREALKEAHKALNKDEVPIGAVVVFNNKIVGRGHNLSITNIDPSAHAEIIAIRKASKYIGNYRLNGCDLYVTVEPCPMCAGALIWARINRLIYGTKDYKAGSCGSIMNILENRYLNHSVKTIGGVLEKECKSLIRDYFLSKRQKI